MSKKGILFSIYVWKTHCRQTLIFISLLLVSICVMFLVPHSTISWFTYVEVWVFEHCGNSVKCLIVRFVIRKYKILTNFGGIRCVSTIKLKAHGFVKSVLKVHSFLNLHLKNMSKPSIKYFAWKINQPYFLRLFVYLLFFHSCPLYKRKLWRVDSNIVVMVGFYWKTDHLKILSSFWILSLSRW